MASKRPSSIEATKNLRPRLPRRYWFTSRQLLLGGPHIAHQFQLLDELLVLGHAQQYGGAAPVLRQDQGPVAPLEFVIITGKGQNSPGGMSRLKPAIRRLLEGELAPFIKEWCINTDDSGFLVRVK